MTTKPDITNIDSTTWYKESGLTVQEVYYDAPELRHLVYRNPETNDEGTVEPFTRNTYINRPTTRS